MSKKILLKKILLLTICSLILMSVNIKNIYGYGETNTTNLTSSVVQNATGTNTSILTETNTTNETLNTINTNNTNTNETINTTNTNTTAIVPTPPSSDVNSPTITPSIVHKPKRTRTIPTSTSTPVPSIDPAQVPNTQVTQVTQVSNATSTDPAQVPNAPSIGPAQTPNLTPTITSTYEQPIILILPAQNTTPTQSSNPGTGILGGDYFDKIFLALILGFIGLIYEVIRIKYEHKTKRESDGRTLDDFNVEKNKSHISENPNIDTKSHIGEKPNIDTKNFKR